MRKSILMTGVLVALTGVSVASIGLIVTLKACAILAVGLASGIAADSRLKFWH